MAAMKQGAWIFRIFLLGILLLFFIPQTMGISIRPGVIKMNLIPGFERQFEFWVGNTLDEPIGVDILTFVLSDGLTGALKTDTTHLELGPREAKRFQVTLKIPENIIAPGVNVLQVAVYEVRKQNSPSGINVRAAVASTLEIRGLYPGKYLEAGLGINGDVAKQVDFDLEVNNFGTERIDTTKAKFEIYNVLDNSFVMQVDGANTIDSLDSWKSGKITASVDTSSIKEGQYKVVATIFYDANVTKTDAFFRIGQYNLQIAHFPDSGTSGIINEFPVKIKSDWNQPFYDVYVSASIKKNGETIRSFETPKITLGAFDAKVLIGYLDLKDVEIGEYDAEVRVYFSGGVVVQNGLFKVYDAQGNLYKQEVVRKGGFVSQKPKKPFWTTTNILIIVIVFLIVLNALWFMKYLRNKEAY